MKSNFGFLSKNWPDMAELGMEAECQLFYDNSACIFKLGTFAEKLLEEMLLAEGIVDYEELNQYERIVLMEERNILPENIKSIFHRIRILRNKVGHANEKISDKRTEKCLLDAYNLAGWFAVVYCHKSLVIPKYKTPEYDQLADVVVNQQKMAATRVQKEKKNKEPRVINLNPILLVAFIISVVLNIYLLCI